MKLNYRLIIPAVIISVLTSFQPVKAQGKTNKSNTGNKTNWTCHPFDHQIFIENKGQFEGPKGADKILYGAQVGNAYVFITPHGIIYKYTEHPEVHLSPDKKKYVMADPDDVNLKDKPVDHYLTATWDGSTGNVTTIADKEQTYYYTYPTSDHKGTIKVNVFKTVTCHNVYPGVDIKYTFPVGKTGFKYSLIVHPGANLSAVKLKYNGASKMKVDDKGNININSGWGQFVDHAPVSYYEGDHTPVSSSYQLNDKEESFNIPNLDVTKSLVIDPWSTNWTDTYAGNSGYDGAYDVDFDYAGNVFIYGGYNPFQLSKYNSAGVLQWTYNTSFTYFYYGDFCVDKASGISFALEGFGGFSGATTDKISSTGTLITSYAGNLNMNEQWRASYDLCDHIILIAGGGTSFNNQAATLDTNFTTFNMANVMNVPPNHNYHDMVLIATDPITATGYMGTTTSSSGDGLENNYVIQMPLPALVPTTLNLSDSYNFSEVFSISYVATGVGNTNGMNGMAVSPNWFYMYDGKKLQQHNKITGAINNTTTIGGTQYAWGGLDVDLCDDIYVGNSTSVYTYNSALTQTGSIGPFPGNVFDVVLGNGVLSSQDSTLYVCGKGFLSSVHIDPPNPPTIQKSMTHVCSCNCTATGLLTFCGTVDSTNQVSYLWSNGQTTHTATGLCPGNTYTLTIKLGCAQQFTDTFDIPLTGTLSLIKSQTSATCVVPGTATITVSGGTPPYNYLWSNGATTSSIGGLGAGNYCVTVNDSHGCQDSACFIITGSVLPTISITPSVDSLCAGGPGIPLSASGAVSYIWAPSNGLTCTSCPNPTASPSVTTTYTVTGTDVNGCTNKDSIVITVNPLPVITVTPLHDTVCPGGSVNLTASGAGVGGTYSWNINAPGLSCYNCANPTATPTATTIYTVTGTDAIGCSGSTTVTVYLEQPPTITVQASRLSICAGQSVNLTAFATNITSGYSWQPGGMSGANITVTPTSTTTYTVSASSPCGLASATVTVIVNPLPVPAFSADLTSGCLPFCVQFRDKSTSPDGILQWTWNFGNGDSAIAQSPLYCYPKSGFYTVELTDISDSGCSATLKIAKYINVYSRPEANFTYSPEYATMLQPTIQFTDNSTDNYGTAYWMWTFGDGSDSTSNRQNPGHTYQDTGSYCPTLVVMNQHGCTDTATNCLEINPIFALYIPSAFSPNGDSKNDVFMAKGNDIKSFEMYIFDRWGMQLFHSNNINDGWNGIVNGNIAQEDTYVYMITVYDNKNKKHTYTGNVNLVK